MKDGVNLPRLALAVIINNEDSLLVASIFYGVEEVKVGLGLRPLRLSRLLRILADEKDLRNV